MKINFKKSPRNKKKSAREADSVMGASLRKFIDLKVAEGGITTYPPKNEAH